ncbi:MAG: DUF3370 family protein [Cyanobacteria bacterium REEB67]|nr:DUF3370 family protein [Cyanobacteria bacterium REEB67]
MSHPRALQFYSVCGLIGLLSFSVCLRSSLAAAPAGAAESALAKKVETKPGEYNVDYDIQPLKGKLDRVPMFNSNSPEIVPDSGILLSTLDPKNKRHPEAHLKYAVKGPFTIFFHHINRQDESGPRKLLIISLLVYNPASSKASLTFHSLASYVSQPDAPVPVQPLPPLCADDEGKVYAGQGDRVASDYVRGAADFKYPFTINVAPRSYALVSELPVKVYGASSANGRSYFAEAEAKKPIQLALLGSFREDLEVFERSEVWRPQSATDEMEDLIERGSAFGAGRKDRGNRDLHSLQKMLEEDNLAGPREGDKRAPTPPGSKQAIVYGRVSGVQLGSTLTAERSLDLQVATPLAVAYPVSSVEQGTMGTGEIQAAPLIRRYKNSAYAAHGNYCVHYQIDLKITSHDKATRSVAIALSSPLKTDKNEDYLTFFKEQARPVFFRGVIKVSESDNQGKIADDAPAHYYHLVAHRGERLPPFTRLQMEPGENRTVRIELYYTPDATPPQMLTIDSEVNARPVTIPAPAEQSANPADKKLSQKSKGRNE